MRENRRIGETDSFHSLLAAHGTAIEAFLYTLESDRSVREEVWADIAFLLYLNTHELELLMPGQVRAWLRQAARFLIANSTRRTLTRRRALTALAEQPFDGVLSAEEEFLELEVSKAIEVLNTQVMAALERVPEHYREMLALNALGKSGPEIAKALGISHQAVRSRLMRARKALRAAYLVDVETDFDSHSLNNSKGDHDER